MRVPLHQFGRVVAYATVDDDATWATEHRWTLNDNGYAWRSTHGGRRHVYMHRHVLGLERGDRDYGDHINRDKLDNRRANLRRVTPAESRQNTPAIGGTSALRGVFWDKARGKWQARAQLDRRQYHLGRFATEEEAHEAVKAWRREHMPFSEDAA